MKRQNMTDRIICITPIILISLIFSSSRVCAVRMPRSSVQDMCFTGDLIITGTHLGKGKVSVDKIFYSSDPASKTIKTLEVPSIPDHTKIIGSIFPSKKDDPPISTNKLVLFLKKDKDKKYVPIYTMNKGSQGLFWYDKKACYGYGVILSSTPYQLFSSALNHSSRIPKGIDAMRKEIATGLDQRSKWETIKAIKDPAGRAREMAKYLHPRTAPKGYGGSVNLRKSIREIGPPAVPVLVEVLKKAKPADNLNTVVLILYDIGCTTPKALRPATPQLCKLLDNPGPTIPYYILSPLMRGGDLRAIPHVRPFLDHKSKQAQGQAARALAAMNDQESFDKILSKLKASLNPKDRTGYTLELARSIFVLSPEKARTIITEIESNPANKGIHHFIDGY